MRSQFFPLKPQENELPIESYYCLKPQQLPALLIQNIITSKVHCLGLLETVTVGRPLPIRQQQENFLTAACEV
jgi:hypothetical protein